MAHKFSLKKFEKDREKSLEASRNGEYKLIAPSKLDTVLDTIFERMDKEKHPLFSKAESCVHNLAVGCDLPFPKRKKPECKACL